MAEERELHAIFAMEVPITDQDGILMGRHNGGSGGNISEEPTRRKVGALLTGTPEIYFAKAIDNSRLVKIEDPRHNREMK